MTTARASAPVRVLLSAIGGYGHHYLEALLDEVPAQHAELAGIVDPHARLATAWPRVAGLGVPVVDDIEAFFAAGHSADLTVVSSPPHWHVPQSIAALDAGSHVLCDKPLAATLPDVDRLVTARDRAGRFVMVGYQWSFSDAIQALKRDLLAGRYGRPLRCATLCAWPRHAAYYARNTWAGRLRDAATGAWVLDSPANNAMAHHLHNALFLLGPEMARSALPAAVTAELARAYPIESADTAAMRLLTDTGCEVLFLASHVTGLRLEPRFRIECERGVIVYGEPERRVEGTADTGERVDYGDPDATHQFRKLFVAVERVRRPGAIPCGVEAAAAQTACVVAMHESARGIAAFPRLLREGDEHDRVWVRRLDEELLACYRSGVLPSEIGCPWAEAGRRVEPTLPSCFIDGGPAIYPAFGSGPA
jgi:predicted dehydrogenase